MTKHGKALIFIIVLAVLCFLAVTGWNIRRRTFGTGDVTLSLHNISTSKNPQPPEDNSTASSSVSSSAPTLQCKYYNEKDFMSSVAAARQKKLDEAESFAGQVVGGIVPHHLLAGKMIAEFFQYISQDPPDTVIIVAPNHKKKRSVRYTYLFTKLGYILWYPEIKS